MFGFVMQRYVIIKGSINATCPQAKRNSKQAQKNEVVLK